MKVPYNKLYYTGKELEQIKDVLQRGHLHGDGHYSQLVSSMLEEKFGIRKVLMTTSGTHALEMAAMLVLTPGAEVLMPSFTFPSTANSVLRQGARPVFVDINEETLNIDPADIEQRITGKTEALVVVHYAGIGCKMERIMELAHEYGLFVIEDAAQAVNSKYKNRYLGTWGDIGCYSFHGSKNYVCGEGGAIAINNQDICLPERNREKTFVDLVEKAEIIREKGTDRARFLKGELDKYSWVGLGSSYLPSDLLMAFLYAQLEHLDEITARRKAVFNYYIENLKDYLKTDFIRGFTTVPDGCEPNYHLFYILFNENKIRDKVLAELQKRGITAAFHYIPLHSSPMGKRLGYQAGDLPVTEDISRCLLRLPLYTGMEEVEMEYVVDQLIEILGEL